MLKRPMASGSGNGGTKKKKASGSEQSRGRRWPYKIFNDSVHGHIKMHPLLVKIIDTPEFQRLRLIKQLGGGYFVFPGASHNRFEHSIGVAHLAGTLVQHLMDNQQKLKITETDKLCVQIAGLCHDLGHGPYSHLFEKFMKHNPNQWRHEDQSVKIFTNLIRGEIEENMRNKTYGVTFKPNDITFIQNLITGEGPELQRRQDKAFLFEIVNNVRTGIDVDKMDYFSRDCLGLGMKTPFSHERYVMFARVCKVGANNTKMICMRDKEAINMYELFHVRYMLHNNVYQHRVVKAIEMMIVDALLKAEPYFNLDNNTISEAAIDPDPTTYLKITDEILQEIMHSTDPRLNDAKSIIRRIDRRDLYRMITCKKFSPDRINGLKEDKEKQKKIVKDWLKNIQARGLKDKDFTFEFIKLNYGSGDKDPIRQLRFYRKNNPDVGIKLKKNEISYLLPKKFEEVKVMLFYTGLEPNIQEKVTTEEDQDDDYQDNDDQDDDDEEEDEDNYFPQPKAFWRVVQEHLNN